MIRFSSSEFLDYLPESHDKARGYEEEIHTTVPHQKLKHIYSPEFAYPLQGIFVRKSHHSNAIVYEKGNKAGSYIIYLN